MPGSERPFRFGVSTGSHEPWVPHAKRVEELGFDVLLLPDHFHRQLAVFPALTAAAMATTKLRVGTQQRWTYSPEGGWNSGSVPVVRSPPTLSGRGSRSIHRQPG
jgi:hypothetical protein